MKNIPLLSMILVILASGCNNYQEQAEQLQATNQELSSSLETCNSLLEEYRSTLNDIETRIYRSVPEAGQPGQTQDLQQLKSRVNNAINQIDSLLQATQEREQAMRGRAYSAGSRVGRLQAEVDTLNRELAMRDSINESYTREIADLENNIEDLNAEIEDLNNQVTESDRRAKSYTDALNYAYYTTGTEDELIEKQIVEKTGGLFGLFGQVKQLNPRLDLSQLERIDRREMNTFQVNAEADDLLMVSPHPAGSYTLESNGEESATVVINNPEEFWKVSRYLVVVTDD